jgi:hypothetical protein
MQVPTAPKYWFYDYETGDYNHTRLLSLPNCGATPASAAPAEDTGGAGAAVIAGAVAGSVGGAGASAGSRCTQNKWGQRVARLLSPVMLRDGIASWSACMFF